MSSTLCPCFGFWTSEPADSSKMIDLIKRRADSIMVALTNVDSELGKLKTTFHELSDTRVSIPTGMTRAHAQNSIKQQIGVKLSEQKKLHQVLGTLTKTLQMINESALTSSVQEELETVRKWFAKTHKNVDRSVQLTDDYADTMATVRDGQREIGDALSAAALVAHESDDEDEVTRFLDGGAPAETAPMTRITVPDTIPVKRAAPVLPPTISTQSRSLEAV
jgi:hypothetical protein